VRRSQRSFRFVNAPGALPLHNGVSAWWAALHALTPRLTYAYVMGMTGGVTRTAVCSNACLCREWREVEIAQRAAVEAMGYRVRPVDTAQLSDARLQARLARSIDHGAPVPWFRPEKEGVLIGYSTESDAFLARAVTAFGEQREETCTLSDLREASLFLVTRSSKRKGLRSRREALALLEWTACALRPPIAGGCVSLPPPAWNAVGLAAYDLWADLLEQDDGGLKPSTEPGPEHSRRACPEPAEGNRTPNTVLHRRALWWLDARRASAAFLRELAGKQRTPWAVRLRRAADLFEEEFSILDAGFSIAAGQNPRSQIPDPEWSEALRRAGALAAQAMEYVAEAAFLGLRLAPTLRAALQEPPDAPLRPTDLQEVIYLARAGIRPLRQLAARRLAGSDHPQAIATLTQLLYDPDGPVSETALWALQHAAPEQCRRLFEDAFRHAPRDRRNTDQALQRALLFVVTGTPDEDARRLLRAALEDTGEGDRDPCAVREWAAALLHDRYSDRSVAQFRDALENGSPEAQEIAARYLERIGKE